MVGPKMGRFKEVPAPPLKGLTQQVAKGFNISLLVTPPVSLLSALPIVFTMGDNTSYNSAEQAQPGYSEPPRPTVEDVLRALAEGQRMNQDTMNGLAQAVATLVTVNTQGSTARPSSNGPKVKEPRTYDGDRSNGKLDDHIRDVTNWVSFYQARNHWTSEREAVEQAATYLTGRMHRIYQLQNATLLTMTQYIEWLRRTFKDNNEQYHLRDEWQATVQGHRTVLEYASDLIYLAARIVPAKSQSEIKEHFRAGLSQRLQMKLAEHPEWDDLGLDDFIARPTDRTKLKRPKTEFVTRRKNTKRIADVRIQSPPPRGEEDVGPRP